PSSTGSAIAHWEGNTLVIETTGYNGRGMLENVVHSEAMRMTQRITKSADGKTLDIDITLEDPAIFTRPVELKRSWIWVNGQQPIEVDCEENPREDEFSAMLFEDDYHRAVRIRHEGAGDPRSSV